MPQVDVHLEQIQGSTNDFDRSSDLDPQRIYIALSMSDVQFSAIRTYLRKIQAGVTTTSVETAINAL